MRVRWFSLHARRYFFAIVCSASLVACTTNLSSTNATPEPKIITVSEWGGTRVPAAIESTARAHTISRITLHHQGEAFPRGKDARQYLRNLQLWSRETKKWLDIPYHFVIDLDGNIYQGRDIRFAGDTNTEYDPAGHALIEVVGNFEDTEPNSSQLDAVVLLMAMLSAKYNLPVESIRGHRDYARDTVCPGKNLYRFLENGYFREQVGKQLAAKTSSNGTW